MSIRRYINCSFLICGLIGIASHVFSAESVVRPHNCEIGILEDWCESFARDNVVEYSYSPRVRMAFRVNDGKWEAHSTSLSGTPLQEYSGMNNWHFADMWDEREILVSTGAKRYNAYCDSGMQVLISTPPTRWEDLPRTDDFSGELSCPVRKPAILTTCPGSKGGDGWKKISPAKSANASAVAYISNNLPDLYTCEDIRDANDVTPRARISKEMMRSEEVWQAKDGRRLFALQFLDSACVMNLIGDHESSLFWFYMDTKGQVKFIERDLTLLQATDFDGDGTTEFLFWINAHNQNGYNLWATGSNKGISFSWNYH